MTEAPWLKALHQQNIVTIDRILSDPGDCWVYGYDNSRGHHLPECVVFVLSTAEVQALVQFCYQYTIPLTARGKGTGTTGSSIPVRGGMVISFEKMRKILHYSPQDRIMVVEPGVTNAEVQEIAAQDQLFWGPDPTSAQICSVGGNLALNAAGPKAVKYGTTRDNTLGLTAITGDGKLIKTGVHTTKGVVGYDLTRLIIGSEGTLAIITEAVLKLTPKPQVKRTLQASFETVTKAAECVSAIMGQPYIPCALEFIDEKAVAMIAKVLEAQQAPLDSHSTSASSTLTGTSIPTTFQSELIIELDGQANDIEHAITAVTDILKRFSKSYTIALSEDDVQKIWNKRKSLSPALRTIAPKKINEDVVVPVSRLPELITGIEQLSQQYKITIINFGHAGNGNIHVNLLINPDDPTELSQAERCLSDVFDLVINLNGTLSGEHGIGRDKMAFIEREISTDTLNLMAQIKTQFDPKSILNPGKIWDQLSKI